MADEIIHTSEAIFSQSKLKVKQKKTVLREH